MEGARTRIGPDSDSDRAKHIMDMLPESDAVVMALVSGSICNLKFYSGGQGPEVLQLPAAAGSAPGHTNNAKCET